MLSQRQCYKCGIPEGVVALIYTRDISCCVSKRRVVVRSFQVQKDVQVREGLEYLFAWPTKAKVATLRHRELLLGFANADAAYADTEAYVVR